MRKVVMETDRPDAYNILWVRDGRGNWWMFRPDSSPEIALNGANPDDMRAAFDKVLLEE